MRSCTAIWLPSDTNIFDPCVLQARWDTGNLSVNFTRPSFRRWNSSSKVISLLMEAGGMGANASFAHSTWPVAASIRIACSALVFIAARAGARPSAKRSEVRMKKRKRCMEILRYWKG